MIKIAVDAMGGDFAPDEIVKGGIEGAIKHNIPVILVGDENRIRQCMKGLPETPLVQIQHAAEAVEMGESFKEAFKRKKDTSIARAAQLVGCGEAGGLVAAGNTAAAMAASILYIGRIPGIDRPAIATLWPGLEGPVVMLDSGAIKECKPHHLVEFAQMGDNLARQVLKNPNPRIGLLNIGQEASKGNELSLQAHALLSEMKNLAFIGNVEAGDLLFNKADVVVCDGFTGNMILKANEGTAQFMVELLKREAQRAWADSGLPSQFPEIVEALRARLDYAEHGGSPVVGLKSTCIITHGSASAKSISNAIRMAHKFATQQTNVSKDSSIP
jgi:glycerol-3-phosphate acyltransferase PlsX